MSPIKQLVLQAFSLDKSYLGLGDNLLRHLPY